MATPTQELLAAAHEILAGRTGAAEPVAIPFPREFYAGIDTALRQYTTAWFLADQRSAPPRDRTSSFRQAVYQEFRVPLGDIVEIQTGNQRTPDFTTNDIFTHATERSVIGAVAPLVIWGTMYGPVGDLGHHVWPPETPEARATREAAEARAKELLRQSLTAAEATEADKTGKVTLTGKSGARYRVPINGGFIEMVDAAGREMGQACAVPVGDMPTADRVLAKILHLKDDDTALMKIANVWPRVRLRQRTTPCNPLAPVGW